MLHDGSTMVNDGFIAASFAASPCAGEDRRAAEDCCDLCCGPWWWRTSRRGCHYVMVTSDWLPQ